MYNFQGIYCSENSEFSNNQMQSPVFVGRNNINKTTASNNSATVNNNLITDDNSKERNNANQNRVSVASEPIANANDIQDSGTMNGVGQILPDVLISDESTGGKIRTIKLEKPEIEEINIGFNLTRSQWDPYPWVKSVDKASYAERAGLREGDCLIKVGEEDLLGLKIGDVASLVRSHRREVSLIVWSVGVTKDSDSDSLLLGPLPLALTRLSSCLASVLRAAECPVCARTIPAPAFQCPSGHLLCATCRNRMEYCPLCRSALGRFRNLLADEVYNSVLENFDLRPDKRERLTKTLFGEDAKFIDNRNGQRSLGKFQDNSPQVKWGTQKLLDRLLPGRARSTGNIARIGVRNRNLVEDDRDVSRSLSTLDIARCSTEVSPSHSLPTTAVGSIDSLHQSARYAADQNEISNRVTRQELVIRYNCPVDSSCRGTIAGDVQSHIVLWHDVEVVIKPSEGPIKLCNRDGSFVSLLHKSGILFYPKYFRDERNKGHKIWCWIVAATETASKYQMNIEVYERTRNVNKSYDNTMAKIHEENLNIGREVIVSAVIHHHVIQKSDNHYEDKNKRITEKIIEEDIVTDAINKPYEFDDVILEVEDDNSKSEANDSENNSNEINSAVQLNEPILKFSIPVLSLMEFNWNDIVNNATKSVFLSDSFLKDNLEVFARIEKVN